MLNEIESYFNLVVVNPFQCLKRFLLSSINSFRQLSDIFLFRFTFLN